MKQKIKFSDVNDIVKKSIARHNAKLEKLDAVEGLLQKHLIDEKKSAILDIMFAIQEVQGELMNLVEKEMNDPRNNNEDHRYIPPE